MNVQNNWLARYSTFKWTRYLLKIRMQRRKVICFVFYRQRQCDQPTDGIHHDGRCREKQAWNYTHRYRGTRGPPHKSKGNTLYHKHGVETKISPPKKFWKVFKLLSTSSFISISCFSAFTWFSSKVSPFWLQIVYISLKICQ